jgi:hypothetical protein
VKTVEIPDTLFRKAKVVSARRGISLERFVTEAVRQNLDEDTPAQRSKISALLDEAEKGPFHGPFHSVAEVEQFLKRAPAMKPQRKSG